MVKEFLRPTKVKIFIVVLLFVLSYIPVVVQFLDSSALELVAGSIVNFLYYPAHLLFLILTTDSKFVGSNALIVLSISIIYWYLLACIIVWLFSLRKKQSPQIPVEKNKL